MTRWHYSVTTREGTEDLVAQHMQQMDSDGWELLNGSTVCGTRGIAYTMWWRKEGPAPGPYEDPVLGTISPITPAAPGGMPPA
jgi:hypothetical protein